MAAVHWVVCQGPACVIIMLNTLLCKRGLEDAMFIGLVLFKTMGKGGRYTIMVHKAVLECTHAIEQAENVKTAPVGRNARTAGGWQELNKTT